MPATGLHFVDLRQIDLVRLEPLLEEETAEWNEVLSWDFSDNASQVRRYAAPRALPGVALLDGQTLAGYGYTVLDEPKGMIGDVYLRRAWREGDSEMRLFKVLLDALTGTPGIRRVESQLMLAPPEQVRKLETERFVHVHDRLLLVRDPAVYLTPGPAEVNHRFRFDPWDPAGHHSLPRLLAHSYRRHIDGRINDQFTTEAGASAFLRSLMETGGCGEFFRPASFFATDRQVDYSPITPGASWITGAVLTSFVAPDTAHIAQICVVPEAQGTGLGRELLRRALRALAEAGARKATLTVTSANERAIRLYQSAGFAEMRRFCAVVWDAASGMSHS